MVLGAWDTHHGTLTEPHEYGAPGIYQRAAEWMVGCAEVEDWGCGGGALRGYLHDSTTYIGIDGSASPWATLGADLRRYRSRVEGIVMRGVLEHNDEWEPILDNAVASFTRRLAVGIFTPTAPKTVVLRTEPDYENVPVIAFRQDQLLARLTDCDFHVEVIVDQAHAFYGYEWLILAAR